jgi:hypothetical protein
MSPSNIYYINLSLLLTSMIRRGYAKYRTVSDFSNFIVDCVSAHVFHQSTIRLQVSLPVKTVLWIQQTQVIEPNRLTCTQLRATDINNRSEKRRLKSSFEFHNFYASQLKSLY